MSSTTRSITRARPMPLRCAIARARRRSGMRPTASSPDTVWITNAVLRRAIERFHHSHSVPCRRISSYPGPMEARRRLGKRHMTAILPDSHASPLPWTLDLPLNLGEWNWEAPTIPGNRQTHKKPSFWERFLRWLEVRQHDITLQTPGETLSEAEAVLDGLRFRLVSLKYTNSIHAVSEVCRPYIDRLVWLIRTGAMSSDDLMLALEPFDLRTREKMTPQFIDFVHAWYLEEIIDAIYASRSEPSHDAYGKELWKQFFERTLEMTPQRSTFRLFQKLVVKGVKDIDFQTVPDYYLRLFRAHIMYQAAHSDRRWNPTLAAARHASLFQEVKFSRRGGVIAHCEKLIESCESIEGDDEYRRRIAYNLLQTLAHMAPLARSSFAQFADRISNAVEWEQEEAYHLVRARLVSKARNRANVATYYQRSLAGGRGERWQWLIKACLADNAWRQRQNLRNLMHTSNIIGNLDEVLMTAARMDHGGTILRDMLISSRDPYIAVAAWQTYNDGREKKAKWSWHIWLPYMKTLVEDPDLSPSLIWEAVDLLPFKGIQTLRAKYRWEGIGSRMQLLERMGDWYMARTDVTVRQRLRFIEKCVAYGKVAGEPMSKRLVANLARICVKDLEAGSLARVDRLRYLVKITELHFGQEEGEKVARQLEGWRWVVANQDYGIKPKTEFDLAEELGELNSELDGYRDRQMQAEEEWRHEHDVEESAEAEESTKEKWRDDHELQESAKAVWRDAHELQDSAEVVWMHEPYLEESTEEGWMHERGLQASTEEGWMHEHSLQASTEAGGRHECHFEELAEAEWRDEHGPGEPVQAEEVAEVEEPSEFESRHEDGLEEPVEAEEPVAAEEPAEAEELAGAEGSANAEEPAVVGWRHEHVEEPTQAEELAEAKETSR